MTESLSQQCPMLVRVADLLAKPGQRRALEGRRVLADLTVGAGGITEDAVDLQLLLEAQAGRIICSGELRASWELECRRCLEPMRVPVAPAVTEIFETTPVEGETFPLTGEIIDLEPMLRQVVLLTLPLAPLCDEMCLGPAAGTYYQAPGVEGESDAEDSASRRDPRWAALDDFQP